MFALQGTMTQDEFIQLIHQHKGLIQKICNLYCQTLHDRQDLFQEIIIQLWKSLPKFRNESKASTWMYRVALNTAISDLRKKQIRIRASTTDYNVSDIAEVNETSDQAEKLELLYSALRQLSDIEKALVMLYLDNKSYEEMEDILGINQNNLRVKMNRIKEKLRNLTKAGSYGY